MSYSFSPNIPGNDPIAVWSLQKFLMIQCESLLGPRDSTKEIFQPVFSDNGPFIMNTNNLSGAFAHLSLNAANYWPTTLYELAHETVHLLNPVCGYTPLLEEGFAVAFSVLMSNNYSSHPMAPEDGEYYEAWKLVENLNTNCFSIGKVIREKHGGFSGINANQLSSICPDLSSDIADKLCSQCNFGNGE